MPILLGEQPIVDALSQAFTYFKNNLSVLVPEIFAYASATHQTEITALFAKQVITQGGYPNQAILGPTVTVTMEPEQETEQYVNQQTGIAIPVSSNVALGNATTFKSTYHCHCFGINYNAVLWLQALVKWALLFERQALMQSVAADGNTVTGYFLEQSLGATGLVPIPDGIGDSMFPFQRIVILSAAHIDTWESIPYGPMQSGGMTISV